MARLAGVSTATVSAVINEKASVREEMRAHVRQAMRALDYHADHMARSLKTGSAKVIGMIVPDLRNHFFAELMCGVEEVARGAGYSVLFSHANKDQAREEENLAMLYAHRAAGVVVCSTDAHTAYEGALKRFPVVFVDRLPVAGFRGRAVTTDNVAAMKQATRHLIELGHTDIAIITGRLDLLAGLERIEGFRLAMQEAHLAVRDDYFRPGDYSIESGYRRGLELLGLSQPPTAIVSCNNNMTLGLMQAMSESKVHCPEEISVLSYDDFPWASYFRPRLTAVAQPGLEMGRRAAQMLLDGADEPELIVLKAELRIRQSTGLPRTSVPCTGRIHP
ncbi:MAG: LacI family DNA-binding transcriptional regulator [Bryobacteraceae bacterium]